MSHLQYYAYEGVGVNNRAKYSYSQAVRVGDRIECAGQGMSRTPRETQIARHCHSLSRRCMQN